MRRIRLRPPLRPSRPLPARAPAGARTALCAVLATLAAAFAAGGAPAQVPLAGHGLGPAPRPLHQRLALADAAVVAVVDAVELGRIQLRDVTVLAGHVPSRFEIKRSPARSLELAPGQTALLLLRGARSPYVLVDDERELATFEPASRATWEREIRRLLDDGTRRGAQLEVYLDWADGDDEGLRKLALAALVDRDSPFQPLPPAIARARARAAFDPSLPDEVRRSNAWIAALTPEGTDALLERVADGSPHADPRVVSIALQAGVAHRDPEGPRALVAALRSPDEDVQRAAERLASLYPRDETVRQALAQRAGAHGRPAE